jgi:DNA-binding XRE family transcriptional regulator
MNKVLKRKRQEMFVYRGFGFPVVLIQVPMMHVRGVWTPDVNFNNLSDRLLEALARKPVRLTGNEVRFIRQSLSMTLEQFAQRFGVTHPAVIKWERAGNRPTVMTWAVEKDIRLETLRSRPELQPKEFMAAYADLREKATGRPERVRLVVLQTA